MTITTAEITAMLGSFLWPFFRIAAMVMAAPVFSGQSVSSRFRLAMAVAITLVVAPVIPEPPSVDFMSLPGIFIVFQQILIGVAIGLGLNLVFASVIIAGQVIGMQVGIGFAQMVDPMNGQQVPVLSQLLVMVTTLVYLAVDGHLMLIRSLVDSFYVMPIAPDGLARASMWELAMWGGPMFSNAVWFALPVIVSLLVVKIAFGVLAKASPQMNIFAVGFPVFILSGFGVLIILLPGMIPQFLQVLQNGLELVAVLIRGGS